MEVMHRRVAGLDVHKETVVACVRVMAGRRPTRECRTLTTTTQGLLELLAWLTARRVTHVAMEATGVYWMPVWKILSEGDFTLIVANAAHIKQVPGRKTDLNDAMWIADLLACGLVKASFVPPEEIQELRSLMRTRKQLVREQTRHVQRLEKTLEEANIKLGAVLSDLMGASGRRMIEAMIAGERDPHRLAALAERSVKASPRALHDALHGRLRDHHRFLLQLHLRQWDALDVAIRQIDEQVADQIERVDEEAADGPPPFRELIPRLCAIPGVSILSATTILAEIGRDMSRFPTAGHLIALGRAVPRAERECRQTKIRAPAERRSLAQDHARAMCLGRQTRQAQLLQRAVPSPVRPARAAEGDLRCGCFSPHRHLPHAAIRRIASRPWRRLLRPPHTRSQSQASGGPARQARLRGTTPTPRRGSLMLRSCYIAEVSVKPEATKQSRAGESPGPEIASLRSQ